ncbi:MAG: ribose-phosphate pyrophosphokinase [Marivirga sp.]|jgi:ribose-phosphate pyrophosphokinase
MKKLLFSISSYKYLQEELLTLGSYEEGKVHTELFSDGERYQKILTSTAGRDVILLGGTINESTTLELYDLASAIVTYGANSLSLVVPYFGYSTMERSIAAGEVVTAKIRARLLSSIPRSNNGNRIYLFDLHTEGLPHYFEGHLFPIHVYCKEIVMQVAREVGGVDFVLASTDAGRAKWVESLANEMNVNAAFVLKRRLHSDQTEISAINADVSGKTVIIYDDMIRSGGSIINAAKVYRDAGASDIYVITTHGLFVKDGLNKIKESGLVKKVFTTNTHAYVNDIQDEFLKIKSISALINKSIEAFH